MIAPDNPNLLDSYRAKVYSDLSLFFLYPTPERWPEMTKTMQEGSAIIDGLKSYGYNLTDEWTALANAATDNLPEDYTRIFITAYPKTIAPPYGSVYLEKRLQGESTVAIDKIIRQYQLKLHETNEPPDHIAIVLELIGYLISQDKPAKEPLTYLAKWSGQLFKAIIDNTPTASYYHRLAVLAGKFIDKEINKTTTG